MRAKSDGDPAEGQGLSEAALSQLDPYDIFTNPVLGQEYRLIELGRDNAGEFLRSEAQFAADSQHFDEHIHVEQDETWLVRSGAFVVVSDGIEHRLEPGEQITIPRGTPHRQLSPTGGETHVFHELRPALETDGLLRSLAALARSGRTDSSGRPNLLQSAVLFDAYPGTYDSRAPVTVQKVLFKFLGFLGRMLGYRAEQSSDR